MIAFYKLLASFLGFMFPVFLTKAIREILKENGGEQKLIFFGLRAAEEKTRRTQYDFLCIVIWLLEILILNWFNV